MMDNVSVVTMFNLSGLSGKSNYRVILFVLTLLCYCVIWMVNLVIIMTVIMDKKLHEPMYIFICNLCINGLYGTAGFYPKFLINLLSTSNVISYSGCLLQSFVLHSSVSAELSLLVLMAYDRYVAVCRPLVYHSVMTKQRVCMFVFAAWFIPIYLVFMGTIATLRLRLCGSHIPKIYCVHYLISKLACSLSIAHVVIPAFNYTFYCCHFIFIAWSYVYLIRTCRTSKENRRKFMQTCLPHTICLLIFFVCLAFDLLYMRFGSNRIPQSAKNFMSIVFILIPPMINPLIYGFKLTEIKKRTILFLCS